jgi:hypothetical protein
MAFAWICPICLGTGAYDEFAPCPVQTCGFRTLMMQDIIIPNFKNGSYSAGILQGYLASISKRAASTR